MNNVSNKNSNLGTGLFDNKQQNQLNTRRSSNSPSSIYGYNNQNNILNDSSNIANNKKNISKKQPKNSRIVNDLASKGIQSIGIPKPIADKVVENKRVQKNIDKLKSTNKPLGLLKGLIGGEKQANDEMSDGGFLNTRISYKIIKTISIALIPIFGIMIFCNLIISATEVYLSAIKLGQADAATSTEDMKELYELKKSLDDEDIDEIKDEIGYVTIEKKEYASPYFLTDWVNRAKKFADLRDLKDFYGEGIYYDENSDPNDVTKFYYKLHDVYLRYNKKLGVKLDIPLIMSTLILESDDMNKIFKSNTSDNYSRINIDIVESSVLDYDYDWSNYKISYSSSAHDIEVLAQNMVSIDSNGKYIIDYDKYNEYLKEFLEKKYFLDPNSKEPSSSTSPLPTDGNYNPTKSDGTESWRTWTQWGKIWSELYLGSSTSKMKNYGCAVTSLSILMAKSGTKTTVSPFDPGDVSKAFSYSKTGALYFNSITNFAPNFKHYTRFSLQGMSKEQVAEKLKSYNPNKYYIMLQVAKISRKTPHHFVALDYIDTQTSELYIVDPSSTNQTKLYDYYRVYRADVMEKGD